MGNSATQNGEDKMSKFRVGDKVKFADSRLFSGQFALVADIEEGKRTTKYLIYFIDKRDNLTEQQAWVEECWLELVKASSRLQQGDRVNYIGKDVQIKAGNPYMVSIQSMTRKGYSWIQSEQFGSVHEVATKNLVRIQEPEKTNYTPKFKIGDSVWADEYGAGRVTKVIVNGEYNAYYTVGFRDCVTTLEEHKLEPCDDNSNGESEPFAYVKKEEQLSSNVVHPKHYNNHPSGVECWDIIEHMNFNVGSAMKYIWRYKDKGDPIENLEKAIENINREIERIKKFGLDSNGKLN
jgi:hypothetical protein